MFKIQFGLKARRGAVALLISMQAFGLAHAQNSSGTGSGNGGYSPYVGANTEPTIRGNDFVTNRSTAPGQFTGTANPSPGSDCPAQALSWTQGGANCSANAPASTSGSQVPLTDSIGPDTGNSTATCVNGTWSLSSSTCTTSAMPANCPAQPVNWAVGGSSCSGSAAATVHGSNASVSDVSAPTTGNATYGCNNGTLSYLNGTCSTASTPCATGSVSWTTSGGTCSATAAATPENSTVTVTDSTAPTTGSASFLCSSGGFSFQSGTCSTASVNCSAQPVSWSVGGVTCNGSAPATSNAASAYVTDTATPNTGSANFTCTNGSFTVQNGATCSNSTALCNGGAVTWSTLGGTCSGNAGLTFNNSTTTVTDSTAPTTGSGTFYCGGGNFIYTGGSCATQSPCPAQTLSWNASGAACSANASQTPSGSSVTVSSSNANTGSATFACTNGAWGAATSASCTAPPFVDTSYTCDPAGNGWNQSGQPGPSYTNITSLKYIELTVPYSPVYVVVTGAGGQSGIYGGGSFGAIDTGGGAYNIYMNAVYNPILIYTPALDPNFTVRTNSSYANVYIDKVPTNSSHAYTFTFAEGPTIAPTSYSETRICGIDGGSQVNRLTASFANLNSDGSGNSYNYLRAGRLKTYEAVATSGSPYNYPIFNVVSSTTFTANVDYVYFKAFGRPPIRNHFCNATYCYYDYP